MVATQIPGSGVSWVNEDGVSGINVEACDGKAIAEAIRRITRDEKTWKRYCDGASKRFREMFTKERMIGSCLHLYSELLQC